MIRHVIYGAGAAGCPAPKGLFRAVLLSGSCVAACVGFSSADADDPAGPVPATSAPAAPQNPYEKFRPYQPKGYAIPVGVVEDTIDRDAGGFRSALASHGIGYWTYSYNGYFDNILNHAHTLNGSQVYLGQKPTYESINYFMANYDLSQFSVPDGQIAVMGVRLNTNWAPLGPNKIALATASYYQTFFDRRLEMKAGILGNILEYVGTFVGGSLSGGVFGPTASIPTEVGLSQGVYAAPGINLKWNVDKHFYNKFGLQRSISPDGAVADVTQNPSGVALHIPNAGPMIIDEAGYQRYAAPGLPQTWVRIGGIKNYSHYSDFAHPGERSDGNYALYVLADRQLSQVSQSPWSAYRGVYAGVSVMSAPARYDTFCRYYEARLYLIGFFDSRPRDMISFVGTVNKFSEYRVDAARAAGALAHNSSDGMTMSYSARLYPGAYFNVGLNYVNHPSPIVYQPQTRETLNALAGVSIFF